MPVVTTDGRLVLGLVRGDDRLSEPKLVGVLESDYRPATDEEIRSAFGADGGSLGPIGVDVEVVADEALREGQFVAGANRDGWHLLRRRRRAATTSRASPTSARRARATAVPSAAERSASRRRSRSATSSSSGRGTRSRSARRSSTRTGRRSRSSGAATAIGPGARDGRRGRAAPRRARHRLAGVDRAVRRRTCSRSHGGSDEILGQAEQVAGALGEAGFDVLLDDRDERPGEKFADADLIGAPGARSRSGRKTLEDGDGRRPDARRHGGRAHSDRDDVLKWVTGTLMAKRRQIQRRAVRPDDRAADGRDGDHLPGPRRQGEALRRVPEPHRPRQPAGALERRHRADRQGLGVEAEHFREYRIRVITDKLEQMPELIDRLYKRLA